MKKKTKGQLVKLLDAIYSQYIRLRDADKKWYCKCITCWIRLHRKQSQNCHFLTRSNYKYRRSDDNCFAWCMRCNVFLNWNYKVYTMVMIKKYWITRVKARIGEVNAPYDIKPYEIEEKIQIYKEKVKDLLTTIKE